MAFNQKSMYTDAQWRWLHDKFIEGYTVQILSEFAMCHRNSIQYHWTRLGYPCTREYLKELDREEFNALGDKE